jgi:hypothetical protein
MIYLSLQNFTRNHQQVLAREDSLVPLIEHFVCHPLT